MNLRTLTAFIVSLAASRAWGQAPQTSIAKATSDCFAQLSEIEALVGDLDQLISREPELKRAARTGRERDGIRDLAFLRGEGRAILNDFRGWCGTAAPGPDCERRCRVDSEESKRLGTRACLALCADEEMLSRHRLLYGRSTSFARQCREAFDRIAPTLRSLSTPQPPSPAPAPAPTPVPSPDLRPAPNPHVGLGRKRPLTPDAPRGPNDTIVPENEVLLPLARDGRWGLVNTSGRWVVEPNWSNIQRQCIDGLCRAMRDKRIIAETGGRAYILDENGKQIGADWSAVNPFNEGLAIAGRADGIWLVTPDGRPKTKLPTDCYGEIVSAGKLNACERRSDGDVWGYLDVRGKWALKPRFRAADRFSGGLAAVGVGTNAFQLRYAYVDARGTQVVAPAGEVVSGFVDGYAASCEGASCILMDTKGVKVLDLGGQSCAPYEGATCRKDDSGAHHVDLSGVPLYPARFGHVDSFRGGLAPARVLEGNGVIDRLGRWVVGPMKDYAFYLHAGGWIEARDVRPATTVAPALWIDRRGTRMSWPRD